MIKVSLIDNFSALDQWLMMLAKDQMPYAIARALTDMAQLGKAAITREIPATFSKGGPPKPFTVNSVVAKPATKETLAAEIFIKDAQAKYLQLEETGGTRSPLGAAIVLPGAGIKLDAHGNIPLGTIARLKAQLTKRAERLTADRHKAKLKAGKRIRAVAARDRGVFYVPLANARPSLPGGFYLRTPGHRIIHLIGFAGATHYRPIFKYHERISAVIQPAFAPALIRRLQEGIATRR